MPEDKHYDQANPPNVARGDSATWTRPDGSTYRKAAGGYGWTPVAAKPKKKEAPTGGEEQEKATRKATTTAGETRTVRGRAAKQRATAAQRASERAETLETIAPWMGEEAEQVEGGLGDVAAREATGRVSAQEAGDAMAKKKKKKPEDNPGPEY